MGFILVAVVIWAVAMAAWFLVSKYAKSSDFDRLKTRLVGAPKKKSQKKVATAGSQQVIHQEDSTKNKFAQALVDKYQWGPKIGEFLEQAGLKWPAARFVHVERSLAGACTLLQRAALLFTQAVARHDARALLSATRTTLRASPLLVHARTEFSKAAAPKMRTIRRSGHLASKVLCAKNR